MNWPEWDLIDGIVGVFQGPVIVFFIGVVAFSYFVSIGKRHIGIRLGVILVVIAIIWLIINFNT